MNKFFLYTILFFLPILLFGNAFATAKTEAVVGVLSFRSKAQTMEEWTPLARYLDDQIPSHRFVIRPLNYEEFNKAVQNGELDFAFTNPEHYVYLSVKYGTTRIATLIRSNVNGKPLQEFAGVMVTLASRKDIRSVEDLKGKTIAAVDKLSLGGYLAESAVLMEHGIDLATDLNMIFTDMPHDKVLRAVGRGDADAGFVRTSVLEKMEAEGKINHDSFKIIHPIENDGFPQMHSTPLYPEWPFAALKKTDPLLANKVAVALLSLSPDSDVAKIAGYYGWSIPMTYEKVRILMQILRVEPFDQVPAFTLRDVAQKYSLAVMVVLMVIIAFLSFIAVRMQKLTRGLRIKSEALEEQIAIAQIAQRQLKRVAGVFHNSGEGIIITDADKKIIDINEAFSEITGYTKNEVIGKKPSILRSGRHETPFYEALDEALAKEGRWRGEIWDKKKNGEEYAEFLRIDAIRDGEGNIESYIGIISDVTEHKKQQEQLHHMANFDPLTNLPNRRLFMSLAEQMLLFTKRKETKAVIAFLDLDGFKEVNDRYGHEMGDKVLKKVAKRLELQMRKSDSIARIGGDEFVILLADVKTGGDAYILLQRILSIMQEPMEADGAIISVGASIGATFYPDDDNDIGILIRHADTAMYRAKELGRNRISYYSPGEGQEIS